MNHLVAAITGLNDDDERRNSIPAPGAKRRVPVCLDGVKPALAEVLQ